jgi:MFS superfamily sulfate permease-like transporter
MKTLANGFALPGYDWALLRRDAVAGLTVATVAVPQAMAYALLAGLYGSSCLSVSMALIGLA